jgi:acetyltransferase-like isoleucine patch superfamily enzyme
MQQDDVFIHPAALVESDQIGSGTRIWAFAHVMPGVTIGRGCNVGDHSFVESGVTIGDDAVIKNGVSIWDGVTIEDRVFVGPNAAFTNDLVPRAKAHRDAWDPTLVREGASIGANATIVCGHTIGRYALVGAGTVVTRDVPDFGLVVGNPGRLIGFVCRCGQRLTFTADRAVCTCGRRFRRADQRVEEEEPS